MSKKKIATKPSSASWPNRCGFIALIAVFLLMVGVRLRTLQIPLERDEGEYAYMGQLMLQGVLPYKLAYNMKLPGTYAAYAGIMAVFGQTTAGIHFGFLLINLATLALLFFIARRLLDRSHAILTVITYALLSMSTGVLGLEAHATHLVVFAAMAGLLLLLKARTSRSLWAFAASGAAFGLSFVCKQPGLVFGICGLAILLRDLVSAPSRERMVWVKRMAIFGAAMAVPFLLTCVLMGWAGVFDRFWFWTFVYARAHAGLISLQTGLVDLGDFFKAAGVMRWSWLPALAGLIWLFMEEKRREAQFIISALLAASLVAFTASFYFSSHYFIMVLPAVALLIAIAVRSAAKRFGEAIATGCFAAACAVFVFAHHSLWFGQTPDAASRALYGGNPFPEAVTIGQYIEQHSKPEDTMAILGSEPEIFFYAHRRSATGYIYMYDLMQTHAYASAMQHETIEQIESAKPEFLLLINIDTSWVIFNGADMTIMNWAKAYSQANYNLEGQMWLLPDRTETAWGPEASTKYFDTPLRISIMRRKPGV